MTAVERWLASKAATTWQTGHDLTDAKERREAAIWFIDQMVQYQRFTQDHPQIPWPEPSITDHEEWMASGLSPRLPPEHQGPVVPELRGTSPYDPEFEQAMDLMNGASS